LLQEQDATDQAGLPRHIAIIMDGNGRWAKNRGLPRSAGHASGAETFRRVATHCKNIGVEFLTVYAFSTENWKRPADEVQSIMALLETYLAEAIATMARDGVRMRFFGDTSVLSNKLQALIRETERISRETSGVLVNMCVNYGGRDEILRAAKQLTIEGGESKTISEEEFARYLGWGEIPDPELIIRPGGEVRLSNFLLWQCAYSELYFCDTLWPDFSPRELDSAIDEYNRRTRKFGGV